MVSRVSLKSTCRGQICAKTQFFPEAVQKGHASVSNALGPLLQYSRSSSTVWWWSRSAWFHPNVFAECFLYKILALHRSNRRSLFVEVRAHAQTNHRCRKWSGLFIRGARLLVQIQPEGVKTTEEFAVGDNKASLILSWRKCGRKSCAMPIRLKRDSNKRKPLANPTAGEA